ncbi:hypothetical protein HHI36_009658 [Cryptolaemus montrouzieri]|uniref:Uncharacterized protein n=1 Tax=Cryptolaemus montrouzieri TaxID=559131 RepID=A0ABD2MGM6_9CUCU
MPELNYLKDRVNILQSLLHINAEHKSNYIQYKKAYIDLLNKSRCEFYTNKIEINNNKNRAVWETVKEFTNKSNGRENTYPEEITKSLLDELNKFFADVSLNLTDHDPSGTSGEAFVMNFPPNPNTMCCGYDGLTTKIIKECIHLIVAPLCSLVNSSLNVAFVIAYILHISTSAYSSYPGQSPSSPQYEFEPEVSFTYGDSLNFNFPEISAASHNSVEKPVDEPQEYVPPQSVGAASVPLMPPPAVPVNAVAANVPSANGAVYLGSGSIGVVRLGNGVFALGSGALGYSDGRSQTRPSSNVPVYPRLPASPNLIPAAVPSQPQIQPPAQPFPMTQGFEYTFPVGNRFQDPNSYEILRPERAGFGMPVVRPPRPLRMHFATPTAPLQAQNPEYTYTIPPEIPSSNINQIQQYIMNH